MTKSTAELRQFDFAAGIRKTKDSNVRGGYRYEINNETLRQLGEPVKEEHDDPIGLFLKEYQDENSKCVFLDDDHILEPWVKVVYTEEEHERWAQLFEKIEKMAPGHDVEDVAKGLKWIRELRGASRIPSLAAMNPGIGQASGFQLVPVMGLLSNDRFFKLLMEGKFPVTLSVRRLGEIGYTPFPDIFHDLAGHGTMFLNDRFSNFVRKLGALGWKFRRMRNLQDMVALLYWYTIEFGLKRQGPPSGEGNLSVYGAGIISSAKETHASVRSEVTPDESERPIHRLTFDLKRLLLSHYEFERSQQLYFVIDGYEQLTQLFDKDLERFIISLDADLVSGRVSKIPKGTLLDGEVPIAI